MPPDDMPSPASNLHSLDDYRDKRGGGEGGSQPVRQEYEFTDVGGAKRFTKLCGNDVRYIEDADEWRVFSSEFEGGGRWIRDNIGEVDRMLKRMAEGVIDEPRPASWKNDEDYNKELRAYYERIVGGVKGNRLATIKRIARSELPIPARPDDFDKSIWLLNLKNGTIDLENHTFRPAAREDLITKQANVVYDPNAALKFDRTHDHAGEHRDCEECSVWLRALYRYFDNDEELIEFLQRALGYALTGLTTERVVFILQGKRDAGKSTIIRTMHLMLGDYAARIPMASLMQSRKNDGEAPSPMIARLRGMRFVSALEGDEGERLAEAKVKELVGGDVLIGRMLQSNPIEFKPTHKLFLGTNPMPRIKDSAAWNKVRLIKFEHSIPKAEQDQQLEQKIEAETPGIFNWILEGYRKWRAEGLGAASAVVRATNAAQLEQDDVAAFLDDCCIRDDNSHVIKGALLTEFNVWAAREMGYKHPMSAKKLGTLMMDHGFEGNEFLDSKKTTRIWRGIKLKELALSTARPGNAVHPASAAPDGEELF